MFNRPGAIPGLVVAGGMRLGYMIRTRRGSPSLLHKVFQFSDLRR